MRWIAVCLLALSACRAHSQEIAMETAADDFSTNLRMSPPCLARLNRSLLKPWIVGQDRYIVEGCGHQATYVCSGEACLRQGNFEKQAPGQPATAVATVAASEPGAATPAAPAIESGSQAGTARDTDAFRAALDGRRTEIAACVGQLPVGIQLEFPAAGPVVISLKGPLHGGPEETCVRELLKSIDRPAGGAGTVIHVVK